MRLRIRVYIEGQLHSEEYELATSRNSASLVPELVEKHAAAMKGKKGMVEIEFLDEKDPHARFFRIGTDPDGMTMPIEVRLK